MRDFFLDNLWRWKCDLPEIEITTHRFTLEEAKRNWSDRFITLMRNRMLLGVYRYGSFRSPLQPNYDRINSALYRLVRYKQTGNAEHLVDAANLALIEFEKQTHPNFHFSAQDDATHTEIT